MALDMLFQQPRYRSTHKNSRGFKACKVYISFIYPLLQLIVLPYHTLLHAPTCEAVGVRVKDNVIIIDEAHNLMDTISAIHFVEITGAYVSLSVCLSVCLCVYV